MRSFDWSRAAPVTCDKSSCHPLGNIVLHSKIASCNSLDFFFNSQDLTQVILLWSYNGISC